VLKNKKEREREEEEEEGRLVNGYERKGVSSASALVHIKGANFICALHSTVWQGLVHKYREGINIYSAM
jgi:hypothetical protein